MRPKTANPSKYFISDAISTADKNPGPG